MGTTCCCNVDQLNSHDKLGVVYYLFCHCHCSPNAGPAGPLVVMALGFFQKKRPHFLTFTLVVSGRLVDTFDFVFSLPLQNDLQLHERTRSRVKISIAHTVVHLYRGCEVKKQLEFWINFGRHELWMPTQQRIGEWIWLLTY